LFLPAFGTAGSPHRWKQDQLPEPLLFWRTIEFPYSGAKDIKNVSVDGGYPAPEKP